MSQPTNTTLAAALQGLTGRARQAAREAWYAEQAARRAAADAAAAQAAQAAMAAHYDAARAQIQAERPGLFGKMLDHKARRLALRLAGVSLPKGATIAWATPKGWATGGYRSQALADKAARA